MEKVTLAIQNVKCGGCASTIKSNLERIDGISGIEVDNEQGTVTLSEWTNDSMNTVKRELRRLGYPLEDEDNPFFSKVKSYASCVVGRMSSTEN
jgi:copper chaperone CopZ